MGNILTKMGARLGWTRGLLAKASRASGRLGLRWKLVLLAAALVAATSTVAGTVSIVRERYILESQILSKGKLAAEKLAVDCASAVSARPDRQRLTAVLRETLADKAILYAFIVDTNNRITAHSELSLWDEEYEPPEGRALNRQEYGLVHVYELGSGRAYDFAAPIKLGRKELGLAHVGISVRSVEEPLRATRVRLALACLVMLILGSLFAVAVGASLTKPLNTLAAGAKRIGDGDLSYRIELNRNDELGMVAQQINSMTSKLGDLYFRTLQMLINALEAKDIYGRGHTERVTRYSIQIARRLGLALTEVENVRKAAMIHDIGKIGVKEAILNKSTELTREEYDHVKSHVNWGAHMMKPIRSLGRVVSYLSHHHEHFDGSGYPAGLASKEIPLGSRIIAVADTFDAMTSDRPYRRAMTVEEAIGELKRCSGTQFDPEVVAVFIQVLSTSKSNGIESIQPDE